MGSATEVWDRLSAVAPPPAPEIVLGAATVALILVAWAPAWRFTRAGVTVAHEGAHAFVAVLCGRSLQGVRVHRDTSGVTVSRGPARGVGAVLTFAAGYPGPALLGVLGAWLLSAGYAAGVLWVILIVLAAMALQIRNWFGVLVLLSCAAPVGAITWWFPPTVQSAFAQLLMWFLLLGAPRAVFDLYRSRRAERGRSDADQLAALTRLPSLLWVAAFAVLSSGATVLGGSLLLGRIG